MTCFDSMVSLLKPIRLYSLSKDSVVYAELCAYAKGLKIAEELLSEVSAEGFVSTAADYGITEWEKLIDSTAVYEALPARRSIIRYTLSRMPWDFNPEGIVQGLKSIGLYCSAEEDFANRRVTLYGSSYRGSLRAYEDILKRVMQIMPAHLEVTLDFGSYLWESFDADGLAFDDFDLLVPSWDRFELEGIVKEDDNYAEHL